MKSGREVQAERSATKNERSPNCVDLETKSLLLLRAAERSNERRSVVGTLLQKCDERWR